MSELPKTLNCARCGKPLALVPQPSGKDPRRPACLDCDSVDPITSPVTARWLARELQPPKE